MRGASPAGSAIGSPSGSGSGSGSPSVPVVVVVVTISLPPLPLSMGTLPGSSVPPGTPDIEGKELKKALLAACRCASDPSSCPSCASGSSGKAASPPGSQFASSSKNSLNASTFSTGVGSLNQLQTNLMKDALVSRRDTYSILLFRHFGSNSRPLNPFVPARQCLDCRINCRACSDRK